MSGVLGLRRPGRVAAAVVSVGLALGSLTVGAAQAVAASTPARPAVADAASAADETGALAIAARFDHTVVVDSLTTSTTQVSALPNGTFRLTASAVPVRARVGGAWKAVDLDLASAGGFWAPTVSAQPVQFSAGGSGPLARVQDATGAWIEEGSPFGDLPTPSVKGPTATYPEVLPGVDLRVTATPTGMSEVLVVKNAAAAKDPGLAQVRFGIGGSSLTTDAVGDAHAGAKGVQGVMAGTPTWWDSSQGSTAAGPGGTLIARPVTQSVTADAITLDAAAAATSNDVTYPVFIDPAWSSGDAHAWFIDAGFPNQAYLDSNPYSTVEKSGWIPASATGSGGVAHTARAFWNFDTSALVGKYAIAAQFSATLNGAFNCSIMRQTNLWTTSGAPIGGTWNSTIPVTAFPAVIGSAVPSGCGAVVGFNALGAAQNAAAGTTSTSLALVASSESDQYNWSKWNQGATLTVTYDSYPNAPTVLTFTSPARTCSTNASSPVYIDGTQPISLTTNSTDPDPGNLVTYFGIHGVTNTSFGWSTNTPSEAQGTTSPVTIPANTLTTGEYRWDAQSNDGYVAGPASIDCYFQIEVSPPGLPTVTEVSGNTHEVGKAMTVTLGSTAADDVQVFAIWWTDGLGGLATTPPVTNPITVDGVMPACNTGDSGVRYLCPASGTTSATVTVAPTDRFSTLWVASYDHSGRVSVGTNGDPSTSLQVTSTVDLTGVSLTAGHLWDSGSYFPSATTVQDQSTSTTTTGSTAPQWLTGTQLASSTFQGSQTTVLQLTQASGSAAVPAAHTVASPLDPTGSYTVSFWFDPSSSTSGTVFSQTGKFSDGPSGPAWNELFGFSYASGGLQFCAMRTYSAGACTTSQPVGAGQWTLITGIWDAVNDQARLLLNNAPAPRAAAFTAATSTATAGGLAGTGVVTYDANGNYIGSTVSVGGQIYRPAIFPGVISSTQLTNLYAANGGPNGEAAAAPPGAPLIAAGYNHTCAVAIGAIYCWGYNGDGQLGDGVTVNSSTPVAVDMSGVLAGKTVTAIAAGYDQTCVLASGAIYCWGRGSFGALGDGSWDDSSVPVAVDTSGALAGQTITSITAGDYYTCAVASGQAYCWGYNGDGELGNNSTNNSDVPVAVDSSGVLASRTVTAISASSNHTCAVASGSAYCWGIEDYGELGDGWAGPLTGASYFQSTVPVAVDTSGVLAGDTITSIVAGEYHTCALGTSAQLYCWGYNGVGMLGNDTTNDSAVAVKVDASGALADKTVTAISATAGYHTCVVADDQVYCWGQNDQGQLGNGTTTNSDVPVFVSIPGL